MSESSAAIGLFRGCVVVDVVVVVIVVVVAVVVVVVVVVLSLHVKVLCKNWGRLAMSQVGTGSRAYNREVDDN